MTIMEPTQECSALRKEDNQDMTVPIAVVGMAFKFPGDAQDADSFWTMLLNGRCASTSFPKDRLNGDALYHPDSHRGDSIPLRGGHFINEELGVFDAPFFSISASEAEAMDPQSRSLLETTYHALENAGIPIDRVSNSNTSVYTGNLADDFKFVSAQDIDQNSRYGMVGMTGLLSGRLSWFFNFKGPSLTVDTACSSSLVALDLACQSLVSGSSSMSVVTGCSMLFSPNFFHLLSNMGMLSPDSKSYSFDHRANGYGRGEGIAVLILKRLTDAVRDGDNIRTVIRSTATNQDGRTPGVTQPNPDSQAQLIRAAYTRAGLSMAYTRYFETHGTGTPVGDPLEAQAIGQAFGQSRTQYDPLYIGSVKSNIGHTEGSSGLASVIKAILILERGIIPPNANFERLNPKIDALKLPIKVPKATEPWPTRGLRRISVNSFGASGTNAHVILDDAFHYLHDRGLAANHTTVMNPPSLVNWPEAKPAMASEPSGGSPQRSQTSIVASNHLLEFPRIFTLSAYDRNALQRLIDSYKSWAQARPWKAKDFSSFVDNISYTLFRRRSSFPYRSFAIIDCEHSFLNLGSIMTPVTRATGHQEILFVFTGQGAQWPKMARELMSVHTFCKVLREADVALRELGAEWSVIDVLSGEDKQTSLDRPLLSQSLCTIVQVALCDLYDQLGVYPSTVVGHSSGEIAAAYCIGAISRHSAFRLAYYRGVVSEEVSNNSTGGMMAVGLSEREAHAILSELGDSVAELTVACINSPKSTTVSGSPQQLEHLAASLGERDIFNRRLKVEVSYHSPALINASHAYVNLVGSVQPGRQSPVPISIISSVTGMAVGHDDLCNLEYWVQNLLQPVQFAKAMSCVFDTRKRETSPIKIVLELGPHSTLQGPIRDNLKSLPNSDSVAYHSALVRSIPADKSFLATLGAMWGHGLDVDLDLANSIGRTSVDKPKVISILPLYPFDHSRNYWPKGRLGREFQSRRHSRLDLLGKPVLDWNPLEPRWRHFLKISELPWAQDHKINGMIIYPAVGMLVMAIEAANQLAAGLKPFHGIKISDTHFYAALAIPETSEGIETQFIMEPVRGDSGKESCSWEFRLHSCKDGQWQEHCFGKVQLDYGKPDADVTAAEVQKGKLEAARCTRSSIESNAVCHKTKEEFYASAFRSGYTFGLTFRAMDSITYAILDKVPHASAIVRPFEWNEIDGRNHFQPHIVHPTTLDGILQISLAAFSRAGLDIVSTAVPTEIDHLWLSTSSLSYPHTNQVRTIGAFQNKGLVGYETSVVALSESANSIVLEARGIKLRFVAESSPNQSQTLEAPTCYTLQWRPDVDLNERIQEICMYEKPGEWLSDKYHFVRRYLALQTFKQPNSKVLILQTGSPDTVVALKDMFSEVSESAVLPCADLNTIDWCTESDDTERRMPENTPNNLLVLTGSIESISRSSIHKAYQLLADHQKLVIVRDLPLHPEFSCHKSRDDLRELKAALNDAGFIDITSHSNDTGSVILTASKRSKTLTPYVSMTKYIIVHEDTTAQEELARLLEKQLFRANLPSETCRLSLLPANNQSLQVTYIFLPEISRPWLHSISQEDFLIVRDILSNAKGLLWLTSREKNTPSPPEMALIDGLTRVLRAENEKATIVTACLENGSHHELIEDILRVVKATDFNSTGHSYEPSYYKHDGEFYIGRVVASEEVSGEMSLRSSPFSSQLRSLEMSPPLQLAVETPGLLDSLYFEEDCSTTEPLEPHEVEIKTSHVGLNFKDLLLALGRENGKTFGNEFAGVVHRAGALAEFSPGNRVCGFSPTAFSTYVRVADSSLAHVPLNIPLAHAAAVPVQYVTAWHSLYDVAKLQKGENILIHSAAGGTGQVAVQIAQMIGAFIFATVGSEEKKAFLTERYGIPAERIYSSRSVLFAQAIMQRTAGRGVDVVLNSLSGEGLLASWDLIAPYGRFIELGKKDILANNSLPMRPFIRRATFSAVETGIMAAEYCARSRDAIETLLGMIEKGTLHMVEGFQVLPISKIQEGMRKLQSGNNVGKIVFEMRGEDLVPTKLRTIPSTNFVPDKTYVIAGGTGGLGLAIAKWMVKERGARNLLLLSRSGAKASGASDMIYELRELGATVEAPACDICDRDQLLQVLEQHKNMPPIAGCIQSSMVLRDGLFARMTYQDWRSSTDPKTTGSWNLHTLLPQSLDFFIMLSSVAGIIGSVGQANYAAGNTYMDSLAHYRNLLGDKATALDLGVVVDYGVLAANQSLQSKILGQGFLAGISSAEIFHLLDLYCRSDPTTGVTPAQVVLGIASPSQVRARNAGRTHPFLTLPVYSHILKTRVSGGSTDDCNASTAFDALREQFITTESIREAGIILARSLLQRLIAMDPALGDRVSADSLDEPISRFGIDSLLAIELRSWLAKEWAAEVPIFEILGDKTVENIGIFAAGKSTLRSVVSI